MGSSEYIQIICAMYILILHGILANFELFSCFAETETSES